MLLSRPRVCSWLSLSARVFQRRSLAGAFCRFPSRCLISTASSIQHELKQYLILVPDHPDSLSIRKATKAAHIESATPLIDEGRLPYFGVTLAQHQTTTGTESSRSNDGTRASTIEPEINGSVMVLHAASERAVQDFLENDPYAKQGVWDVAKAQILPFRAG